jgi:hypothetical protein
MLYHRLTTDPAFSKVTKLCLQADNCVGQNKNQYVFKFLGWLVVAAPHLGLPLKQVIINFPVAGHTKNLCDSAFGLIKRRLRSAQIFTPADMYRAVLSSTKRTNLPVCASEVRWMDVKKLTGSATYFKPGFPVNISEVHNLEFSSETPGVVRFRSKCTDAWENASFCTVAQLERLTETRHTLDEFDILPSKELTAARRAQLADIEKYWERPEITVEQMLSLAKPA